ncbi:MAG TPA: hypothetical protein VGE72_24535, partial [Azospirillum sp.]
MMLCAARGSGGLCLPPDGRGSGDLTGGAGGGLSAMRDHYLPELARRIDPARVATMPRGDVAREVKAVLHELLARDRRPLN